MSFGNKLLLFSQAAVIMCELTYFVVVLSCQSNANTERPIVILVVVRTALHWLIVGLLVKAKANAVSAYQNNVRRSLVDMHHEIAEVFMLANGVIVLLMVSLLVLTKVRGTPLDFALLTVYVLEITLPCVFLAVYQFIRHEMNQGRTDRQVHVILTEQSSMLPSMQRGYRSRGSVRIYMIQRTGNNSDQPPSYESCVSMINRS